MEKNSMKVVSDGTVARGDSLETDRVESHIITIRGVQVILDRDLARMYQVEVSQMNRQVKRNKKRFPSDFMFQLTKQENESLKCQFGISNARGGDRALPYAFTEQGVASLSGLLRSDTAIEANIRIMRAFVAMRRFLAANAEVFQRLDRIEYRQLETDQKMEQVFARLEDRKAENRQCIFYDGQVYDAYDFICNLIQSASRRIVLIDNYVDHTALTMLDKRGPGVEASIYTQKVGEPFQLDLAKHDAQYPPIPVRIFQRAHDRFLIIDERVYHVGASLKDLGKKWFAVSLMEALDAGEMLSRLQNLV